MNEIYHGQMYNDILDLNELPKNLDHPVVVNNMVEDQLVENENIIEGELSFKVDMTQLKAMLITSGAKIEGLSDYEIVVMGLNKLVPFGFNFED